jgi:hypothetical protein
MNRKPTAKKVAEVRERIAHLARVQRPSLLDFMLDGYWQMTALPAAVVKDAAVRAFRHGHEGWIIPEDSLGRKGAAGVADTEKARSTAESIRIWIIKNLEGIIDPAKFAVVVEDTEDGLVVAIYRKA